MCLGIVCCLQGTQAAPAQEPTTPQTPTPVQIENALSTSKPDDVQIPEANPARPTVTNPAHIPPVGYLQFEQGFLIATASPGGVAHQNALVQTTRLSVHPRLMVQVLSAPFAASRIAPAAAADPSAQFTSTNDTGDLVLGAQGLLTLEAGKQPTVAVAYNGRVRSGSAPDIDLGSYSQSADILVSGDLGPFHYDTNFGVAEQPSDQGTSSHPAARRAQYNQSLSVTHDLLAGLLRNDLEVTGELWHVTQPLVTTTHSGRPSSRSNAVGALFALGYTVRPNIVLDAGFDHGLTSTSTDWEGFAGVTWLLPHRLWPLNEQTQKHRGIRGHVHRR